MCLKYKGRTKMLTFYGCYDNNCEFYTDKHGFMNYEAARHIKNDHGFTAEMMDREEPGTFRFRRIQKKVICWF